MEFITKAEELHRDIIVTVSRWLPVRDLAAICLDYVLQPVAMLFEAMMLVSCWQPTKTLLLDDILTSLKQHPVGEKYLENLDQLLAWKEHRTPKQDRFRFAMALGHAYDCHRLSCYYLNGRVCTCGAPIKPCDFSRLFMEFFNQTWQQTLSDAGRQ